VLAEKRFVALLAIMGIYVFCRGAFNFAFVLIRGSGLGISDSMVLLLSLRDNKRGTHTLVDYPVGMLADRIGREAVLAIS
jgi:hypothetical protein